MVFQCIGPVFFFKIYYNINNGFCYSAESHISSAHSREELPVPSTFYDVNTPHCSRISFLLEIVVNFYCYAVHGYSNRCRFLVFQLLRICTTKKIIIVYRVIWLLLKPLRGSEIYVTKTLSSST